MAVWQLASGSAGAGAGLERLGSGESSAAGYGFLG